MAANAPDAPGTPTTTSFVYSAAPFSTPSEEFVPTVNAAATENATATLNRCKPPRRLQRHHHADRYRQHHGRHVLVRLGRRPGSGLHEPASDQYRLADRLVRQCHHPFLRGRHRVRHRMDREFIVLRSEPQRREFRLHVHHHRDAATARRRVSVDDTFQSTSSFVYSGGAERPLAAISSSRSRASGRAPGSRRRSATRRSKRYAQVMRLSRRRVRCAGSGGPALARFVVGGTNMPLCCSQFVSPRAPWRRDCRGPMYLSRDHAVFLDGVLIPVKHLTIGTTIAPVPADE